MYIQMRADNSMAKSSFLNLGKGKRREGQLQENVCERKKMRKNRNADSDVYLYAIYIHA